MAKGISVTSRGYKNASGNVFIAPNLAITVSTIQPDCIVYHRQPKLGDKIVYDPACTRLGDGAAGVLSLDSNGVPSITGSYGVYSCTVTFNGNSETVYVSHYADAAIEALFSLPSQDANGFSDMSPAATGRLIYVDATLGNDSTAGPTGNSTDHYTGASPPAGGWEEPSSVNAYQTIAAALAEQRDGFDDWVLLKRGEEWTITSFIDLSNHDGATTASRAQIRAYGAVSGTRPHINVGSAGLAGEPIISLSATTKFALVGLHIEPTFRDPDSVDWVDWATARTSAALMDGIFMYGTNTSILIEDCEIAFCDENIHMNDNAAGLNDIIIRRNVIRDSWASTSHSAGILGGAGDETTWSDFELLIEENIFNHNGWYKQSNSITATGDSGNTTTLTDTGAFAGYDWVGASIYDVTNGGESYVTSHTNDQITFVAAANVDFTSVQSYQLGGGDGAGMATIFNHNVYLTNPHNSIFRKNFTLDSSSIGWKLVATPPTAESEPVQDVVSYKNISVYGEVALHDNGNAGNNDTRFANLRIMDNVALETGANKPTARDLGWGYLMMDWRDGCFGNNIIKDVGINNQVENTFGLRVNGKMNGAVVAANKIVDIGDASVPVGIETGSLLLDNDDVSEDNESPLNIVSLTVVKNDMQQKNVASPIVGKWDTTQGAGVTLEGQRYFHSAGGGSGASYLDGSASTLAAFIAETGETGHSTTEVDYINDGAGIPSFQSERGGTPTVPAFITEALAQREGNWDATLAADRVAAHMRRALADRPDIKMESGVYTMSSAAAGNTQTVSLSSGFGTPKGLLLIMTGNLNGTPGGYNNVSLSYGFTDGTNQWCSGAQLDPEITPDQICEKFSNSDCCVKRVQGSFTDQQSINSFGTDQFVMDIDFNDTGAGEQFEVIYVAFTGDDIESVTVGNTSLGTGTAELFIPTGNATDLLFAATTNQAAVNTGNDDVEVDVDVSFGFAINGVNGIQQAGWCWFAEDGRTPNITVSQNTTAIYNDALVAKVIDGATESYAVPVTRTNKGGFFVQPTSSASSSLLGWMSIQFKKRPAMSIINTLISTSGQAFFNTGIKGGFHMWLNLAGHSTYNTAADTTFSAGLSVIDPSGILTVNHIMEDGVGLDDTAGSAISTNTFNLYTAGVDHNPPATVYTGASGYNITKNGINFTITTNPAAGVRGRMLTLGVN